MTHSQLTHEINPGLHGEGHPLFQDCVHVVPDDVGFFVNLQPDPMTCGNQNAMRNPDREEEKEEEEELHQKHPPTNSPRRCPKYSPYPASVITARAAASSSAQVTPGRTRSIAARWASWTMSQTSRCFVVRAEMW